MKDPAGGVCVEEAEAEEEEEGGERKTGVPAAVASAAAVWAEGEPRAAPGPALPRGRDSGAWPHHLLGSDPSFSSASSRLRPEGDHLVLHFMGSLQREQCSHQKGQRWPTQ
ncbi:uncharacterized protein LOC123635560 isoform X1 [Lemur catta]|uniref:uncharacterized protein LOC123635560 isoform X1 n=1 Tax=Lemur catta TaxID=9447 RepID=UPI001E26AD09|nr:uncharacterized protein LOC123635560 isoform X1 [Lemur catta]